MVQFAFCGDVVEDALTAVVWSARFADPAGAPTQQVWFHGGCLAERLHPSVPFLADVFDE